MKGFQQKVSIKDIALLIMRDMELDEDQKLREQLPKFIRWIVGACQEHRLGYFMRKETLDPVPTIQPNEHGYPIVEKPCNYLFMLAATVIDRNGNEMKLDYATSNSQYVLIKPANGQRASSFGFLPVIKEEDDAFLFSTDAVGAQFNLIYAAVSADEEGYPYVDARYEEGLTSYCRARMATAMGSPNEARAYRLLASQAFRRAWGSRVRNVMGTDFMRQQIAQHNNPWQVDRNQYATYQNNVNTRVLSGEDQWMYSDRTRY